MQASDAGEGSREALVVPTDGILHPQTARAERKLNSGFSCLGRTTST